MCLANIKGPFVATRDIVCYKHLHQYEKGQLRTSYREMHVELGETYDSDLIVNKFGGRYLEPYTEINIGLHSFFGIKNTIKDAKECFNPRAKVIVKCIIPKGSTYYKGKFENLASRASNTLKYVEIIQKLD